MLTFEYLFQQATGSQPDGYQARIAKNGLPDVVKAPTGAGKTGVILAWLWRRLHGPDQAGTPRRLIVALPRWALAEQTANEVRGWLANAGLTGEVALHVVLGSRAANLGDWREDMHQPAIIVGTVDYLVSRALNRGFGVGQAFLPIDFGLLTNGAHWIVDEPQCSPQATATLRQLASWAAERGTAEPFGLTCLSVSDPAAVGSHDDPLSDRRVVDILAEEHVGELAVRLDATRAFRRLDIEPGDYQAIAAAATERHRPGTLTLVVLNSVRAASEVFRQLRGRPQTCTLLHSRFRGVELASHVADAVERSADRIVVTTEVIEAGIDLDAAVLITEAAPWPALIRRAGHCNRTGRVNADAEVCWIPPPAPLPYEERDVNAAIAELDTIAGQRLTSAALLARDVFTTSRHLATLDRAEFTRLFDTSLTPGGPDLDISRFVRDGDDLDVEIAWATWTPGEDGAPDPEVWRPAPEYRCRVPISEAVAAAADVTLWQFDQQGDRWTRLTNQSSRPRPAELLLIDATVGYTADLGFDPAARGPVPDSPVLLTPDEQAEFPPRRSWQSLDEHSEQVREQAAALVRVLTPNISPDAARSVVVAGYLHDAGKAHPTWQDALCALAEDDESAEVSAGRPWAKSAGKGGRLEFAGGPGFRHELASLLLIDDPLHDLLAEAPDQDLARYLVLAHHGRLRTRVGDPDNPRDPGDLAGLSGDGPLGDAILGLEQDAVTSITAMLGHPATTLRVDLAQFRSDDDRSWSHTVRRLVTQYGPCQLAYFECLVRIADWRASAGRELPA
jgi:CRISPR-associated endonuclease/helicase Cas3